jgi:hypothetical protein
MKANLPSKPYYLINIQDDGYDVTWLPLKKHLEFLLEVKIDKFDQYDFLQEKVSFIVRPKSPGRIPNELIIIK